MMAAANAPRGGSRQSDGIGERGKVEFHAANAGSYLPERLPHRPESLGGFTSGFFEAVETLARFGGLLPCAGSLLLRASDGLLIARGVQLERGGDRTDGNHDAHTVTSADNLRKDGKRKPRPFGRGAWASVSVRALATSLISFSKHGVGNLESPGGDGLSADPAIGRQSGQLPIHDLPSPVIPQAHTWVG